MKQLIPLLLFLFAAAHLHADCSSSGMYYYPKKREIGTNSMIIIEAYAGSQHSLERLSKTKIMLLDSSQNTIELKLEKVFKGAKQLTQYIFRPETLLEQNRVYHLVYLQKETEEYINFRGTNYQTDERENVHWKTVSGALPPYSFDPEIAFNKSEVMHYGCGPAVFAHFDLKESAGHEVLYFVELMEVKTGKTRKYILKSYEGKLSVGHGMCSGGFSYESKGKYKVRISPVNTEGKTRYTASWIEFDSPWNQKPGG